MLKNGYQALVTFANAPDVELWEKVVTPPGYSFGEKIDITTQHNEQVRTAAPRALAEVKDSKFTCAYDPEFYNVFLDIAGVNTTITKTFPDGSQLAFFGYLADFEPEGMEEGKQPEASVTTHATNTDPEQGMHLARRLHRSTNKTIEGRLPDESRFAEFDSPFPEALEGGTGTAFLVNEYPPVWVGPGA